MICKAECLIIWGKTGFEFSLNVLSYKLMELDDKTLHIGVTDIIASTKLLKTSQAQFEVDYLYEGSAFNIGRPSFRPYGLNERVKIEYKI